MVLTLQFRNRYRLSALIAALAALALPAVARAEALSGAETLRQAQSLYESGQYFRSARYAFSAAAKDPSLKADAYSWMALGLIHANLPNSASYFFIKTLQSGNTTAIRRVLHETQELLAKLGPDLFRKYLIRHTKYDDYDEVNRSAYLYALGKEALLSGDTDRAIGYLNGVSSRSSLWAYVLELRGTAHAIAGKGEAALSDFRSCARNARDTAPEQDLRSRCRASEARTLYEMNRFEEADRTYDRIPKSSFVWTDILFEQAWNSFAKGEYNRSLGKLVSYKSPGLSFVFNTEVDVLTAQSYLALCLYPDANAVINEFNGKYAKVGEEIKRFVEGNSSRLPVFYQFGKKALQSPLHTSSDAYRMANRFVRGPYFQGLVAAESAIDLEKNAIARFDAAQGGVSHFEGRGFPGFLDQVLGWRQKSIELLGGAFVKNSLMDYHQILISDFEKMAFIKLEMLKRAKEQLLYKKTFVGDRSRGNRVPTRRDDQYYWSFNGEFWNDELGDYVFGLESQCNS